MTLRVLKPGTCMTCGEPCEWMDLRGNPVDPPSDPAHVLSRRRVGHEACKQKEREDLERRQAAEIEEARRKSVEEARLRRRAQLAEEILWPIERLDELDLGKVTGATGLRSWTPGRPGVLLYGTTGAGKTFAMRAFALAALERFQLRPAWINVNRWLDDLKVNFDKVEAKTLAAESAPILILDDLGAEKLTEWAESKLERILSVRFDFERPVFVTTNLTPAGFKERFGPRLLSRLSGLCEFVQFHGTDRRGQTLMERKKRPISPEAAEVTP